MGIPILTTLLASNSLGSPRPIEELQAELRSPGTQLRAMRAIVGMLQQSYDMGVLCSDVLRIAGTADPELKVLCHAYLRSVCADRPACQLAYAHMLLKELSDGNWKIQSLAASDAVLLGDEMARCYSNCLRRICAHERKVVRMAAARCMSLLYMKDRETFFHENMGTHLRDLLHDSEDDVTIAAARSLSSIESQESLISGDELCRAMDRFVEKGNSQGVRAILGAWRHRKLSDKTKDTMMRLLRSSDICIFYLSSKALLEHDQSLHQQVYDIATGFMECRAEQLHNLLVYIDSFFDRVASSSTEFVVMDSDPGYIKDMKIRLLMRKYDTLAEGEIKRLVRRHERVPRILECALEFNVVVRDVLMHISPDQHDEALRIIYRHHIRTRESMHLAGQESPWSEMIGHYLESMPHGIGEARIYITLCGMFCRSVPLLVSEIGDEANSAQLMKFYCLMMCRGVIDQCQCLRYLRTLYMAAPHIPRIRLLIKHISKIDAEDIYESLAIEEHRKEVGSPVGRHEDSIHHSLLFQSHGAGKDE